MEHHTAFQNFINRLKIIFIQQRQQHNIAADKSFKTLRPQHINLAQRPQHK